MGQVPEKRETPYLIIGNGRLAKHITYYFDLLGIPHLNWYRKSNESLNLLLEQTTKVLVLINDDEIESFILKNQKDFKNLTWIHCSGLLSTELAESAHPLMTFTNDLYDLETYRRIPFITEKNRAGFNTLFPELKNQSFEINSELKPLYHAWCVMSGNFTSILWQRFFEVFQTQFGIDKKYAFPYLEKITNNLINNDSPLTGPLARGDKKVIEKNLLSLKDEPFVEIYRSFVNVFNKMNEVKGA